MEIIYLGFDKNTNKFSYTNDVFEAEKSIDDALFLYTKNIPIAETPYLIARCSIKDRAKDKIFSKNASMDYMGSAEFEFGAVGRSMKRIFYYLAENKYKLHSVNIQNKEGKKLYIASKFDETNLSKYIGDLRKLANREIRCKEFTLFPEAVKGQETCKTDLWWDIENDCLFSFDHMFMKRLNLSFNNSKIKMENNN